MEINLRPKNIIVVGGATGIGYATAQKLLDNDCEIIILASRNVEKLEVAAESLKKKNENQRIGIVKFDITDINTHDELMKKAENTVNCMPNGLVISSGTNFNGSKS